MELLGPSDSSLALEVHRLLATGFLEVVPARANPATDE
jgi:hypothetical protein